MPPPPGKKICSAALTVGPDPERNFPASNHPRKKVAGALHNAPSGAFTNYERPRRPILEKTF